MTDLTDRQADVAGGFFAHDAHEPDLDRAAILALEDGSVWRGWSVGPARAMSGHVQVAGELVLVEGETVGVLRGIDVDALQENLAARGAGHGPGARADPT